MKPRRSALPAPAVMRSEAREHYLRDRRVLVTAEMLCLLPNVLTGLLNTLPFMPEVLNTPLSVVATLAYALLLSGLYHALLRRMRTRRDEMTLQALGCMSTHIVKVFSVQLLVILCMLLAVLPGAVLVGVGRLLSHSIIGWGLMLLGMTAAVVMLCMSLLYTSMALPALSDDPAESVLDCLRRSLQLMRGRVWHYLRAVLPALALPLLTVVLTGLLLPAARELPVFVPLCMLLCAPCTARMRVITAVFYEHARKKK